MKTNATIEQLNEALSFVNPADILQQLVGMFTVISLNIYSIIMTISK